VEARDQASNPYEEAEPKMVVLTALSKVKDFIVWSWTYLWAFWFLLVSPSVEHDVQLL
jgi:hypothetical protein